MKLMGPDGLIQLRTPYSVYFDGETKKLITPEGEYDVEVAQSGLNIWVFWNGYSARFQYLEHEGEATEKQARAPMTGKIVSIPVKLGQHVHQGETLAILEAMKMEYKLDAEIDGEVEEINAQVGELVDLGHVIVKLK